MKQSLRNTGAYLLHLFLSSSIRIKVGALGEFDLPAGWYCYVGSARRNLSARVERHRDLAAGKRSKIRWHIDYLLVRPEVELRRGELFQEEEECAVSARLASGSEWAVPIPGFGASDCKANCPAHLYRRRRLPSGARQAQK
jgi:Uri superfamily endonuclease